MLHFIKKLAQEAGNICLAEDRIFSSADVDFKSCRDIVTVVDKKVEAFIIDKIGEFYPGHSIIGEETGVTDTGSAHCWIIDPIDGTTSYFHRQPYYSVSIAYQFEGITHLGVVYAPALGQLFSAEKDGGAYLNDTEKLRVSSTDQLLQSVLATGFACIRADREINNLVYLAEILPKIRDMRRCGSAAIDLAYVAAGKVDGFWEMDLNIYDIAAGVLLVQEAGGKVSDMLGKANYPGDGIVASNPFLFENILEFFKIEV